jgi:magnesium chelatase family protein
MKGQAHMVARVSTVSFQGIEAVPVDVQVMIAPGKVNMHIVGLPDKAVAESRERVQAALHASGLSLPAKKVTVNLAPADLPKEGSHFDLPIALGLMAALGAIPGDALDGYVVLGELSLDGTIASVAGALPAAIGANALGKGLICPAASGPEAAWAGEEIDILAPRSLIAIANHFRGTQVLGRPVPAMRAAPANLPDLSDIKGQETAKRALEVAAAGGHNLIMVGPPGSGKSMLAARLPSILPPLSAAELLEVSMIHSIAGQLAGGKLSDRRPFRAPHHSASMAAMVGGGFGPGRARCRSPITACCSSTSFPNSPRRCSIRCASRWKTANASSPAPITAVLPGQYPAGRGDEPVPLRHGRRAGSQLHARAALPDRLSGPHFRAADGPDRHAYRGARGHRAGPDPAGARAEPSADVALRVALARSMQQERFRGLGRPVIRTNSQCRRARRTGGRPDPADRQLLSDAAEKMRFSARAYHRILKVARTLADLDGAETGRIHLAEAISYRIGAERVSAAA